MNLRLGDNFYLGVAASALLLAIAGPAAAQSPPPKYFVKSLIVPPYYLTVPFAAQTPAGFSVQPTPGPVFKPHRSVVDDSRGIWVVSNERGQHGNNDAYNPDGTRVGEYRAGISIFQLGSNSVLAKMIIDEPQFAPGAAGYPQNGIFGPVTDPYTSSTGQLFHGMDLEGSAGASTSDATGEDTGEVQCPLYPNAPDGHSRLVQTVFLPVVLPPGSQWNPANFRKLDPLGRKDPSGQVVKVAGAAQAPHKLPVLVGYDAYGRPAIMAPMGAECHPRHPHGIDIDTKNGLVYLLIEHMGLKWNANRTDFALAQTTDEEAGGGLAIDISNISSPKIVTAYLAGHGAHEIAVNPNNGFVFMPDHEDSWACSPTSSRS